MKYKDFYEILEKVKDLDNWHHKQLDNSNQYICIKNYYSIKINDFVFININEKKITRIFYIANSSYIDYYVENPYNLNKFFISHRKYIINKLLKY